MQIMSRERWLEFVLTGTRTGKLAVTRSSGSPHVTPIWFLIDQTPDGDDVVFTTGGTSLKAKALRRDPRFALCVDDQQPPYSYVLIEARAGLSEDLDELLTWATRLGGRYMGAEAAEQFGRRNAVPGELLVRGRITRVTALADIAG
ncbi:MAG TPA: PPOX class F420-dependent oxidoreductase [Actinophytocola sp.]|uniref:PPOX class F420-dependent oxidoreductase n=1 Tax=Actinophytocola sp. TaxID=1872138 RepID=UPI002DDD3CBE|nr:PPOX class F420-dependent oxidoreductase [Actinophytocola sp.]HEV2780856.1 PPOX class F420-dependent oxidoreductase [Actinophytocola sp.]